MSSEDDDDLKSLRTALLSSIRSKTQDSERSQEIYDTDIDDLDALRRAALKSVKPEVKSLNYNAAYLSTAQFLRPNSFSPQFASQLPLGGFPYQPRMPPFRLRPPIIRSQARSNLIVIQTVPDENDVGSSSNPTTTAQYNPTTTTASQLILPQDRYSKHFSVSSSVQEKVKRNDKWARFEHNSSSSESDEDEITTLDEVNSSGNDESEQENEIASDDGAGRSSSMAGADESVFLYEIKSSRSKNDASPSSSISSTEVKHNQKSPERLYFDDNPSHISFEPSTDDSFTTEPEQQIFDVPQQKRTYVASIEKKKVLPDDDFDFLLEEPSDSIEFLDDEPTDYEAIVASLKNNDAQTVAATSTDNDSSSSNETTGTSSSIIISEKERLKNRLDEVHRKLAEIHRYKPDSSPSSSKNDDRKRKSSKSKRRSERKHRKDERDLVESDRANVDRRRSPMLSSVVAVRNSSPSNEKLPKRKRKANSPELREHVLRKAVLPSLLELNIERSKNVSATVPSPSKPKDNTMNITKGDLRVFLTSKKSTPSEMTPSTSGDSKQGKIIKLKKELPISERFTTPENSPKKIRSDITRDFPVTVINHIAGFAAVDVKSGKKMSPVAIKDSPMRRVIVGHDESVDTSSHQSGQGNRSLFCGVHVQWKKSGAETIKEGKSTGGKIKLKRP